MPDFFSPERYNDGKPDDTPMAHAHFGQPEDVGDLLNQYGTYNIQPTNEQENAFPMIAQALPTQWKNMEVRKEELENL